MNAAPVLKVEDLTMRFGGVVALDAVSLEVRAGEVTCLLGDNGAGKSTLIRLLSGVHRPTGGRMILNSRVTAFDSPRAAREQGIATVHQDLALVPMLSVWRNFFLGAEPGRGRGPFRRIDTAECRRSVTRQLHDLGIALASPDQPVATLSGGERQCLAIARALHTAPRLLILDEPTAALGVKQAELVLRLVARARAAGTPVILVTHNPAHAFSVGDHFVVLRQGRVLADLERAEVSVERLAVLMTGSL